MLLDRQRDRQTDTLIAMFCTSTVGDVKITRYAQRPQTSADPEDPDFGLWTPGSEA